MLSLPDYKEKQIVFINGYEVKDLSFLNDCIVVKKDGQMQSRVSCHKVFCVFIVGECTFTSGLIKRLLGFGISIFFMSRNFNVYANIGPSTEGNYPLRLKQYNLKETLPIAKHIIKNKISNQIKLVTENPDIEVVDINRMNDLLNKVDEAGNNESLLGLEGNVAKIFFQNYFKKINWYKRMPRTKCDINNLLLDMGYTYLFNFIDAHLRLYGFDRYLGVYHQMFFQRKSLVCDIEEPFRCIIDRQLLKSMNLKQINKNDFHLHKREYQLPYQKSAKYSKLFLHAIMERKEDIFNYVKQYYNYLMTDNTVELPKFNL